VLNSNRKGAIAETKIAAAATQLGIPVLRPIVEHGRYDLAFEIGARILRVQCKWGALDRDAGVIKIALHTSRCTPNGYVRTPYAEDEIDLVAAYCDGLDCCYLLPAELATGRMGIHLRLTRPLNGQRACINLASEYEFAGAVAQLEERCHGMAEARGSNPLSSISLTATPAVVRTASNEFRNHFGYYLEQAAAGAEIHISRHGKPFARLLPAAQAQPELTPA
jgi:prevent-host-death family protein